MTEGSRGEREKETPDVTIHDPDDVIGGVDAGGGGGDERATGTPNTIYDLSSVLFHALEGGASYDAYIEDAEREGDQELADFFIQVRDEDAMRAEEAQRLLAERTSIPGEASGTARGVAATEGEEYDLPPTTEPRAEGAPSGDPRREYAVTEMPDEELALPGGEGGVPPRSTEEAASPRPEPSDDFPGTEPVREDASTTRMGEVAPPEEIPPERAGEIPTAEEVPPPRTEDVPMAEEMPSGTPPQAPPGDVQRGTTSEPLRTEETAGEQERQIEREREDEGLVEWLANRAKGELADEGEQRRDR
jgi:hypothetical protein